jgi:hypothetical protein
MFKNAGTSLDRAFRDAFGERWTAFDANDLRITPDVLADFIRDHPDLVVLSSHRAQLPVPDIAGVTVIPVFMVRHPLDRIRSAASFVTFYPEGAATGPEDRNTAVRDWVRSRLDSRDRLCRNSMTYRLAMGGIGVTERDRAFDALTRLPFAGLVEEYDASVARLTLLLRRWFPELFLRVVHDNRTRYRDMSLGKRLKQFRLELGNELFAELRQANQDDLMLWNVVRQRYPHDLRRNRRSRPMLRLRQRLGLPVR